MVSSRTIAARSRRHSISTPTSKNEPQIRFSASVYVVVLIGLSSNLGGGLPVSVDRWSGTKPWRSCEEERCGDGKDTEEERAREQLGNTEEPQLGHEYLAGGEEDAQRGHLDGKGGRRDENGDRRRVRRNPPGHEEVGQQPQQNRQP